MDQKPPTAQDVERLSQWYAGKYCRRALRPDERIEDVVSDLNEYGLKLIAKHDPTRGQFSTFFTTHAWQAVTSGLRLRRRWRQKRGRTLGLFTEFGVAAEAMIDERISENQVEIADLSAFMLQKLDDLKSREKQILILRYWEGLTFKQCAERMRISYQRAEQLQRAAVKNLRKLMNV